MKQIILISLLILLYTCINAQPVIIDSISINGQLSRMTSLLQIQKSGIIIDSIVKVPESGYAIPADSLVYIGESYFEYYSEDEICIAQVIIFDEKIDHISLGKYIVNNRTTFDDLRNMFPIDCKEIKPIRIFEEKKPFGCCGVPVRDSEGKMWDMRITFFFQNSHLVRVDFWEPM